MNKLSIPHDAVVFVGDGQKALFLRNTGDVKYPNLIAENSRQERPRPEPQRCLGAISVRSWPSTLGCLLEQNRFYATIA